MEDCWLAMALQKGPDGRNIHSEIKAEVTFESMKQKLDSINTPYTLIYIPIPSVTCQHPHHLSQRHHPSVPDQC